eukprot:TRINITY_DN6229_c0_g2_i2.p2 TRINITY_DN6229_c0_g2~~TRINITY_DN6229_c0_g2_i2.p2  ORF type:complete len:186 (-),score=-13.45 TRINITY_DN6229_c0_g2_i2:147-704(-)
MHWTLQQLVLNKCKLILEFYNLQHKQKIFYIRKAVKMLSLKVLIQRKDITIGFYCIYHQPTSQCQGKKKFYQYQKKVILSNLIFAFLCRLMQALFNALDTLVTSFEQMQIDIRILQFTTQIKNILYTQSCQNVKSKSFNLKKRYNNRFLLYLQSECSRYENCCININCLQGKCGFQFFQKEGYEG